MKKPWPKLFLILFLKSMKRGNYLFRCFYAY
uniref:Uncharacterized protein n=1 Tax=Arundo donax TaxID=35708 RepID=A0A0A8Z7J8_ARUDO